MPSVKPKILVVDDEPLSLKIIKEYLESAGYSVVTSISGNHAWQILTQSSNNFSLVIADRVMPGINGVELTRQIQNQPIFKDIPVIMLTGAADKDEVIDAVQGGVYDFLLKPVERDLLLMVVKRALMAVYI